MSLDVYLLPALTSAEQLADRTVVVIDVLRATTTITQALAAGACEVIPCLEVDEARRIAASLPAGAAVLGGERHGQRIEGFDLGNSPAEYTSTSVGGKTLVFTTTNGTRAMQQCGQARRILLGSFNSLSALVAGLRQEHDFAILCAGTDGHVTLEDVLLAGAILHATISLHTHPARWNDEARLAANAWSGITGRGHERLVNELLASRGGRNLVELGMSADVLLAAQIDTMNVVAELDRSDWRIRPGVHQRPSVP